MILRRPGILHRDSKCLPIIRAISERSETISSGGAAVLENGERWGVVLLASINFIFENSFLPVSREIYHHAIRYPHAIASSLHSKRE